MDGTPQKPYIHQEFPKRLYKSLEDHILVDDPDEMEAALEAGYQEGDGLFNAGPAAAPAPTTKAKASAVEPPPAAGIPAIKPKKVKAPPVQPAKSHDGDAAVAGFGVGLAVGAALGGE